MNDVKLASRDKRMDLLTRRFVSQIIEYLMEGGDHANARLNMTEHGVPGNIQKRVINGLASRY